MVSILNEFFYHVKRNKWIVIGILLVSVAAGLYLGYKKVQDYRTITPEEQAEIDVYNEVLAGYDKTIADLQNSLDEETELVNRQQEYVDNAIYMKLDPAAVKQTAVQYAITYEEGTNANNVNQTILAYLKDGGLKDGIENPEEMEVKYWAEVMASSIAGNVLNITFWHYDMEKGEKILSTIKSALENEVKHISEAQGEFSLKEITTSAFEIVNVGILNTQNSNRDKLRGYYSTKADYESKLFNNKNAKEKYIKDNTPEALEDQKKDSKGVMLLWGIFGLLAGILLACLYVFCRGYLYFRNELQMFRMHKIPVLSIVKKGNWKPELERTLMDIAAMKEAQELKGVHLQSIYQTKSEETALAQLSESLKGKEIECTAGTGLFEKAEDLKACLAMGGLVAVLEAGKVTEASLLNLNDLCRRYQIKLLGCILVEK